MSYYILDIETRPDPALSDLFYAGIKPDGRIKDEAKKLENIEEKKESARKDMSVDHDFTKIICVGLKEVGGKAQVLTFEEFVAWCMTPRPEIGGVKDCNYGSTSRFVTFNGKGFDIPVIMKTAVKMGYKADQFPYLHFKQLLDRYKDYGHIDLQEKLSMVYGAKYKSLDLYLQIYLGIKKTPIDHDTASDEEKRVHCLEDLENTEKMYLLFANKLFQS